MRRLAIAIVISMMPIACERESRTFRELPPASTRADTVRLTDLQPGKSEPQPFVLSPYQKNAYGIAEGKRLFSAMNCTGCHANGGGAIGPALMDDKWIYGWRPEQIYSSIVQGRPNGMPAYGGRLPQQQVWQLVAYVESLSGMVPEDAATSRNDDMSVGKPENRLQRQPPTQTGHR
jgi:cytochrome c oxidase cbb3-type subunit 3